MMSNIFDLLANFLRPLSSRYTAGRFSRRLLLLTVSLSGLMVLSLSLALAEVLWDDVTPTGSWNIGYFVQKVGDNAYFAFQDNSTNNYALIEVTTDGAVEDVIPAGSWNAVSTHATVVNGKGYFAFRDAISSTISIYELDGDTWTDITPAGTWNILNGSAAVGTKGYFALRDDANDYYLYELDGGSWDDVTPTGSWNIGYFVQKVGDNAYFAFQDNSTNNYALVEVTTGGAVADVIPAGSWNAVSTHATVVNGKGYFAFRDAISSTISIYEVDNGSWNDVTPAGTWNILNGAATVGSKGYFALRDDANSYHLYELDGGSWDDVTPTGSWNIGYFVQKVGDNAYFAFQDNSTNNYALVEVTTDGAVADVIPAGSWNAVSTHATVVNGKGYFAFRDSGSNTFHIYEVDGGTWTDITPSGTWTIMNGVAAVDVKGYFALRDDANDYHLLQQTPCSATITVTNANDSGSGSLRQAITSACDGTTIDFAGDYTIYLDSTLSIDNELTITGSGHTITISGDSGNDGDRDVQVFNIATSGVVTLNTLSVVSGTATQGGGLYNSGQLTISNSVFADNKGESGGGLYNYSIGNVTILNSVFWGNTAEANGGGIANVLGTATVMNSTLNGNSAAIGGGILSGGGIFMLTNSSLSGNSATEGGGLFSSGTMTLINNTVSGNSATTEGGGVHNINDMHLKNNIIANNGSGGDCHNEDTLVSNINNLIEDGSCSPALSGDPHLAALGDYGGPSTASGAVIQTLALLPGSPAIDAGDSATCSGAEINNLDQRGVTRPAACDMGAFESQGFFLTINGGNNQSTPMNTAFAEPLEISFAANDDNLSVGAGQVISFTAPGSGASLSPSTFSATTDASSIASSIVMANNIVGDYQVAATASGLDTPVSFNLTNTPPPDLAITKTVTLQNTSPSPGETVTYTIVIANSGDSDAEAVTVQDTLPALMAGDNLNEVVTITAHTALTFTLNATIANDAGYGTTILNTASFSHTSGSGSDTAGFTTQADTTAPTFSATPLITPTNGIQLANKRPTFDWLDATDTQSGVISYTLLMTSSNSSLNVQAASDTVTSTTSSFTPSADLADGIYTWTVRAYDVAGNVSSYVSPVASFTLQTEESENILYFPLMIKE